MVEHQAYETLIPFFEQMKHWELTCVGEDAAMRKRNTTSQEVWERLKDEQFAALSKILQIYTTQLPDREEGMSYGNPTEYDPDMDELVAHEDKKNSFEIIVRSNSSFRSGEVTKYELLSVDGRWVINSKHRKTKSGHWKKVSLV